MAITSYTTLLSALANWNNRSDLTAQYPDFIALAEAHFNRTLRVPDMEASVSQSVSAATVALPSDFLSAREVYVDAATDIVLEPLTPWALRAAYPTADSGTPVAYTIKSENIVLAPPPSAATTLVLNYYQKIPALTASNETNWLITDHPDLYLRACRYYSHEYLKHYEAADREMAFVNGLIESMNTSAHRKRVPANPLASKPLVRE